MSEKPPRSPFRKYLLGFWLLVLLPLLLMTLLITAVGAGAFGELPGFDKLENPKSNLATEVYSADMKILGKYYYENRTSAKYRELSPFLVDALIATEDVRFRDHSGVDLRGLGRVLFKNIVGGNTGAGGGSTLSQQLAKMLFPREKMDSKWEMAIRKIKEWIIATRLERQYTKEEIIVMYLNQFDFINSAVGIKSAARVYFNTTPDSLRIEQAAMLVGMAKNPSLFNPARKQRADTALHRRNVVMSQMMKYKFLTQQQFDSLKQLPLNLRFRPEDHNEGLAPYFREYLRDKVLNKWCREHINPETKKPYDLYRDGLRIYTTIDSRMQKYAEEAVAEHLTEYQRLFFNHWKKRKGEPWGPHKEILEQAVRRSDRYRNLKKQGLTEKEITQDFNTRIPMTIFSWNGEIDTVMSPMDSIRYYKMFLLTGFMSVEPQTGYIKAWVGGINHRHFQYDHVKDGARQVGSTFKPFVYTLAMQEGVSPCEKIPDIQRTFRMQDGQEWSPQNSDGKFTGESMSLKKALANSINSVTAYLINQYGPEAVISVARKMGITAQMDPFPSLALGTPDITVYEMVGAYSAFVNKGIWVEPICLMRIEDKNGNVLQEFYPRKNEALSEETAYLMVNMLRGVVQYGTGMRLLGKYKFRNPIGGKTGTTQNQSDAWFMGITPELVSGVWVGCEDRSVHFWSLDLGQGAHMAMPIWALYMQKVYADKSLHISMGDFEPPSRKMEVETDCSKYDSKGGGFPYDGFH